MKRDFSYPIFQNIESGGGLFGGRIKTRNAIEALLAFILAFFILKKVLFFLSDKLSVVVAFVMAFAAAIFFVAGIDGRSITEHLMLKFRYRSHKGKYSLGMPVLDEEENDEKE